MCVCLSVCVCECVCVYVCMRVRVFWMGYGGGVFAWLNTSQSVTRTLLIRIIVACKLLLHENGIFSRLFDLSHCTVISNLQYYFIINYRNIVY
jgi:hypothetical protein